MPFASNERPFPGLRPFEFGDRAFFFGRDQQVRDLFRKLLANRFVAVVGASGSGKSSLVKAGLRGRFAELEAAGSGKWRVVELRPLGRPLHQLATALVNTREPDASGVEAGPSGRRRPTDPSMAISRAEARLTRSSEDFVRLLDELKLGDQDHLVVIVDQFEELFRYPHLDEGVGYDERALFVKHLLAVAQAPDRNYHVLVTMRSEFIGECTSFQGLAEAINDSQFLTPRLTRAQRQEAILGPIELAHGAIAPELVQRLLNDVGHEPDQLPVMQHALMRSWLAARDDDRLELSHYESVGCMAAAISNHAEKVFQELGSADKRRVAELLFKALTDVDRDGRVIRRPLRVGQLVDIVGDDPQVVIEVIDAFRAADRAFLVPDAETPIDEQTVIDITHEALIRKWDRLKTWVQEEADNGRIYARLRHMADTFNRDPKALLGLREARDRRQWWDQVAPTPAWAARYSEGNDKASVDDVGRLISTSIAEGRRQYRMRVGTLAAFAVIALAAAVLSSVLWLDAAAERDRAVAAEAVAAAERDKAKAAEADAERRAEEARLANEKAAEDRDVADEALRFVYRSRADQAIGMINQGDAVTAALVTLESLPDSSSPDRLVRARPETQEARSALVRALNEMKELEVLHAHGDAVLSAVFSPDGRYALTASADGTAMLWERDSGKVVGVFTGHTDLIHSVVFSPDGSKALTASADGTARLWDVGTGETLQTLRGHDRDVYSARFSPDGGRIVTAGLDGTVRIWDTATGRERGKEIKHSTKVNDAAFSPDGRQLVSAADDGVVRIWRSDTGRLVRSLDGHWDRVVAAEFDSEGLTVLTGSADRTARIWDVASGEERLLLQVGGEVSTARFSPGGRKVLTAASDGTARLWSVVSGDSGETFGLSGGQISSAAFSPDGEQIITAHGDGTSRIWATEPTGSRMISADDHWIDDIQISPDGHRLVTMSSIDGIVKVWNADSLELITDISTGSASLRAAHFSADGTLLFIGSLDGELQVWDIEGGTLTKTFPVGSDGAIHAMSSPKGDLMLVVSGSEVTIWDLKSGDAVRSFPHNEPIQVAVFSPTGDRILIGAGRTAYLLDASSGEILKQYDEDDGTTIIDVAFSGDGERLLTVSEGGTATIWETTTGELLHGLGGLGGKAWSARFSPDGAKVMTVSDDGIVRLWDTASGLLLQQLADSSGWIGIGLFSADGQYAVTASDDGIIRVSRLFDSTQDLVRFAQQHLPRCLTVAQRWAFSLPLDPPDYCATDQKWPLNSARYHIEEGKTLLLGDKMEQAEKEFAWAEALDETVGGNIAAVFAAVAVDRLAAGRDELANTYLEEAGRRDPTAQARFRSDFAAALAQRAAVKIAGNDDESAEADLNRALAYDPAAREAHYEQVANALVERSVLELRAFEEHAIRSLEKAVELSPENRRSYETRYADALAARAVDSVLRDVDYWAEADLEHAVRMNPEGKAKYERSVADAYIDRTTYAIADADDHDFKPDLDAALALSPAAEAEFRREIADAFNRIGWDRMSERRYAEAVGSFDRALVVRPRDADALTGRGAGRSGLGEFNRAVEDLTAAIAINPAQFLAYDWRGWTLLAMRDFGRAQADYTSAIELNDQNVNYYIARATASASLLQFDAARNDIRTAGDLGYDNPLGAVFENVLNWRTIPAGDEVSGLITSMGMYRQLSPEERGTVGAQTLLLGSYSLTYPIANLHVELQGAWKRGTTPTRCDEMASHFSDPYRVTRYGKDVNQILDGAEVIEECTAAIESGPPQPRLRLQRARAYTVMARRAESEESAEWWGKEDRELRELEDIRFDGVVGYPMALNNISVRASSADGDYEKAALYALATFNRVAYCCAASSAEAILADGGDYEEDAIARTVSTLLDWAATLGSPSAHIMLADLVEQGRSDVLGDSEAGADRALLHLMIAERMYRERAAMGGVWPEGESAATQEARADGLRQRIDTIAASIPSSAYEAVASEADAFVPAPLDSVPDWATAPDMEAGLR